MKLLILVVLTILTSSQALAQSEVQDSQTPKKKKDYQGKDAIAGSTEEQERAAEAEKQLKDRVDTIKRRRQEPRISYKYYQGEYLIYDCQDRNFVCVNADSYSLCQKWRTTAIEERRKILGCAPLKKFDTQEACFADQYEKIHNIGDKSFCVNPKLL